MPNKGGVAGYVDRMRRKYRAKWGMQMAGMNFKTRSSMTNKSSQKNVSRETFLNEFPIVINNKRCYNNY